MQETSRNKFGISAVQEVSSLGTVVQEMVEIGTTSRNISKLLGQMMINATSSSLKAVIYIHLRGAASTQTKTER